MTDRAFPKGLSRTRVKVAAGALLAALSLLSIGAADAARAPGDPAPDFTTDAALGGKAFRFSLAEALKQGPVVLYFFPKAFTSGCTIEAHDFAEATPKFKALGATVIGMSHDDIDTLKKFSVEACRNSFAVAADGDGSIMKRYDAAFKLIPGMADRISYVISPAGKIIYTYASLDPDQHVKNTMKAVADWQAAQPR